MGEKRVIYRSMFVRFVVGFVIMASFVGFFTVSMVSADVSGDFDYQLINGGTQVEITGYHGSGTAVVIPGTIDGKPVTTIGYHAFYGCIALTSVTIGSGVTTIGGYAFYECIALTSVTIPDSVTSIEYYAFALCTALTSVTIGSGVTTIGTAAFFQCFALTSVTIPDGVTSIGDYAFDDLDALTSVTIGSGVRTIGNYAFRGCSALTSVIIPDSVTRIGSAAFWYCSVLTSVTIGSGVTTIRDYVFADCPALTSVIIPDSVTHIGNYAFLGCSALTSVTMPDSVTTIGAYSFYGCSVLTSVTIPDSVTSIGDGAFSGCSALTSVTIPDSVAAIGGGMFSGCSALTSVTIGSGVTTIGNYAFSGCSALTSVTMPDAVTTIGAGAFQVCSALTSVTIPDSVTTIGAYAFYGCSALTSVTMPDAVTTIGAYAFRGCSALTSVTIGSGVTTIGNYAFYRCSVLTSVTIPDSVTSIGDCAFEVCSALTSVTIGSGVTTIGAYAFYGCSALTSVTIGSGVTTIRNYAFAYCSALSSITFCGLTAPTSVGAYWIYSTASGIQGHAYAASNFPAPGGSFNGLLMGAVIPCDYNAAPVLDPIGDKIVAEGTLLTFAATASDSDIPVQTLTFSLSAPVPTGMSITSAGVFTWTPDESQGPGTYTLDVVVSDGALTDSETITVTVNEVNRAPVLGAIGSKSVDEMTELTFTSTATDPDIPVQTLTFSLAGAPTGASIAPGGVFTWTPTEAQGPGSYTFDVVVSDGYLTDSETITVTVGGVDEDSPVTTCIIAGSLGNDGWYVSDVTIALSATDDIGIVASTVYSFDGTLWDSYTDPVSISSDGSCTVYYYSVDNSGNVEGTKSVTFKIDKIASETTCSLTGAGSGGWYRSNVGVELTWSDGLSGVDGTYFSLDGVNWQPYLVALIYTDEGLYSFSYYSVDLAGNTEPIQTVTFGIDKTPPSVDCAVVGLEWQDGYYRSDVIVTLTAHDNTGTSLGITYCVSTSDSPGMWKLASDTAAILLSDEAIYTIEYYATDNAGNEGTHQFLTFCIDETRPSTSATLSGTGSGGWYRSDVIVTLTPYDALSQVWGTAIIVNSGTLGWYTGPLTFVNEGQYSLEYYSIDYSGNTELTQTVSFWIDKTAPVVTISAPLDGAYYKSGDVLAGVFSVVEINPYTTEEKGWSIVEGAQTYEVTATDSAGNVGSAHAHYTIDDTAPVVTISAPVIGAYYKKSAVPAAAYSVIEFNPYAVFESGYSVLEGIHTYTVIAIDDAGNIGSASVTYYVGGTQLVYIGDVSGQYSDPVTVSAVLTTVTDSPVSGRTISFTIGTQSVSATTDGLGIATATITLSRPAGLYTVKSEFAGDSDYVKSSDSDLFTISKETVTILYTGDTNVWTAGVTVTSAPVRLSAVLTQEYDGNLGDLSLARVKFVLTNAGAGPSYTIGNIPVSPLVDQLMGLALTTKSVAVGNYLVTVTVEPLNQYWIQTEAGMDTLTVSTGDGSKMVSGGGWIPDFQSLNSKGSFGFTVTYQKNGAPRGNFIYLFRGTDGYNYLVKSNSWQDGGLSFTGAGTAFFTGRCTVQQIDRATGEVLGSTGNFRFTVDVFDGDLSGPHAPDTLAIKIWNPSDGTIWRQIGTTPLGGGNIVIHSR